jgi:hypothetical protein
MEFLDSILNDVKNSNSAKPKTETVYKRPGTQLQTEYTNKKLKTSGLPTGNHDRKTPKVTAILKNPNRDLSAKAMTSTSTNGTVKILTKESDEKILSVMHKLFGVPEPIKSEDVLLKESIQTVQECKAAVNYLMQFPLLAVDCEWVTGSNEYDYELCLIQIATPEQKAFLFDVYLGGKRLFSDGNLRALLEKESIIKVFHDCRWDSYVLWKFAGTKITNVFDTQVAYACFERSQGRKTPLPISYQKLLSIFALGEQNLRKEEARLAMRNDSNYWKIRPLTQVMVEYASFDVIPLPLVYRQISSAFSPNSIKNIYKWSEAYVDQHRFKSELEVQKYQELINEEKEKKIYFPKYCIGKWDSELNVNLSW